jgi:hypothetical protein
MAVNFAKLPDLLRQPLPTSRQADKQGVTRMQPHIHESVPCRLVLQLRTYRCNAVDDATGLGCSLIPGVGSSSL